MNPVVHFEIPAEDRNRMVDFYTHVFGWRARMLGPEMGNYVVVTTTDVDDRGRPKNPGSINGSFFQKSNDKPDQYPSVVIAVDDIRGYMKKVKAAGGEPLGEPMEIPGVGSYLSCRTPKATEWRCYNHCLSCKCIRHKIEYEAAFAVVPIGVAAPTLEGFIKWCTSSSGY